MALRAIAMPLWHRPLGEGPGPWPFGPLALHLRVLPLPKGLRPLVKGKGLLPLAGARDGEGMGQMGGKWGPIGAFWG